MVEVEIIYIFLWAIILMGVVADIKTHKIPNKVIVVGMILGILCRTMEKNGIEIRILFSILFPFVLLFPVYCLGMIGAGDVKFLCMIGVVMEPVQVLYFIFYACVFGAVWAGTKMIREKSLKARFEYLKIYMENLVVMGKKEKYFVKEQGYKNTIPFALPIALSFLLYLGGMY